MSENWTTEELAMVLHSNLDLAHANAATPAATRSDATVPQVLGVKGKAHKYGVAKKEDRTYNGIVYDSKKEASFAAQLDLRVRGRDFISFWLRQVPFMLPGGSKYLLDFVTFYDNGEGAWDIEYIEVKGRDLPMGKLKRKQTEELFGIHIKVV